MLPNQPILLTAFGDGDSEDTIRCTLIHQVINQLPIPGNQGSFQILMQSPFPTRHNIPSLTTSRTLQRLLQNLSTTKSYCTCILPRIRLCLGSIDDKSFHNSF
ncbi:uncharacterized protein LOC128034656 isoform X2 [Gossypium raimondii]|uniref:uncharacterized protein LOC128034656 isoform X2 n=1 Tax=Gossypium raimondii TaxID=29730 RepID=UPI00227B25D1|nr:uncharacterized protein LOC128034656 isoform X2 [Gossypium raimondii]